MGLPNWTYVCHYLNPANWILESNKEHANRKASAWTMSEYTNNDTLHLIVCFQHSSEHQGTKMTKTAKAKKINTKPLLKDPSLLLLPCVKTANKHLLNAWYLLGTSGILWVQVGRPSEQTWTLTAPTSQTSLGLQWPCSEPSEWRFTARLGQHCVCDSPHLHLWSLTWNLNITILIRKYIFQISNFGFHVSFWGVFTCALSEFQAKLLTEIDCTVSTLQDPIMVV